MRPHVIFEMCIIVLAQRLQDPAMDVHFSVLPLGKSEISPQPQSYLRNWLGASDVMDAVVSQLPDETPRLPRFLRLPHPRTGASRLITEK